MVQPILDTGISLRLKRFLAMNETDLVAVILSDADDPQEAGKRLLTLLNEAPTNSAVRQAGFSPELFEVLQRQLPTDPTVLANVCARGAAWVAGRRSVTQTESWELVISLPPNEALPKGIRRSTAETIIGLVIGARHSIRMTAPFFSSSGFIHLVEPVMAAAERGVYVELFLPPDDETETEIMRLLDAQSMSPSAGERIATVRVGSNPWPHLKVVIVDRDEAYVGSANITRRALEGENLELGVLLRGSQVGAIDGVLDLLKQTPNPNEATE